MRDVTSKGGRVTADAVASQVLAAGRKSAKTLLTRGHGITGSKHRVLSMVAFAWNRSLIRTIGRMFSSRSFFVISGMAAFLNGNPANAEAPPGAVSAETREQVALLSGKLHELMKERALDQRGVWFNSVDPVRQAQLLDQINRLAPDKRDQYWDGEMSRGLAAFGDIRSKPFCVFDSVQTSPLIYGDHRYSLPNGPFTSGSLRDRPPTPGMPPDGPVTMFLPYRLEVRGKEWSGQFDSGKMSGAYENIVEAKKKIGDYARYRNCFRYVRLEEHPERQIRGMDTKWLVLEWLGGDLIDSRSGQVVLNMPVAWAAF